MKLIPVQYYGFTAMDKRFSSPMLPWIVSEIRKRDYNEKISLGVEDGILQAYNPDFELQFSHKIYQITRFSQADQDPTTFLYLMRDDQDISIYCYLFQAKKKEDVSELYKQMKDQSISNPHQPPQRSMSSAANLTSLCVDISPSLSNFFEVLYIGKIKVWQKKVPETFIDDALEKFKVHEEEKANRMKLLGNIGRLKSEDNIRRNSIDSTLSTHSKPDAKHLQRSMSSITTLSLKQAMESDKQDDTSSENSSEGEKVCPATPPSSGNEMFDDHNRTMVLQVDRTDLRLISPDRKVILLHKHHRDISTCLQGINQPTHFGFIARETNNSAANNFIGYIFKCESNSIANDAVNAITQAFCSEQTAQPQLQKPVITSCDHCPMVWFHKLCTEIEHLSDRKTQAAILRKLDDLEMEEQQTILAKFKGATTSGSDSDSKQTIRDQNEFLMMLLRAHCESKQSRHVHDTAENRSEFLNQYLGGGTIFMKAKRSLTNSFEMLKRKASKDDFGAALRELNLPLMRETISPNHEQLSDSCSDGTPRSRSSTIGSQNDLTDVPKVKSPMMDIFLKVGSSPKAAHDEMPPSEEEQSGNLTESESNQAKSPNQSWRQAIFKKVVTPNKNAESEQEKSEVRKQETKRTREELRELWRKSICQAILLVRMEKENARLKQEQETSAVKRIKLEYDEMKAHQLREVVDVWEMLSNSDSGPKIKCDSKILLQAIRQGVPRGKRGDVWHFLAEQYCMKVPPIDVHAFPNWNVSYEQLLKQLTSHQHAILIDLGRTFPNHSYFSSPLGPGQLALFNLLKAYSLLDWEMGYCQGLSFVAGVLLLHMEESQAFALLKHLMFRRGMRQQYLPDMVGLQIKLYQLSRLIHDQCAELYHHFNRYEIATTLYAAPWLLTIFASQFPLGFVTRVFDLIFLESPDVIFRVALALLNYHKDELLKLDNFEEIMNYLKNTLPQIDKPVLDKIMKEVFTTDVTRQLHEYKVEYQVLQEELVAVQPQVELLHKVEEENRALKEQSKKLMGQLEMALSNVQRLEKTRTLQQNQLNRMEMQNRALDVTIVTLGQFILNLMEEEKKKKNNEVELTDEVRRILNQIQQQTERRKSGSGGNLLKMFGDNRKLMVKSLSTGRINLPASSSVLMVESANLRSNSLKEATIKEELLNQMNAMEEDGGGMGRNKGRFFSEEHSNILQQKLGGVGGGSSGSLHKIDIKIQECEENDEKKVEESKLSPSGSIDSGVGTPQSPVKSVGVNHPLSNCCDVNFTVIETKELKSIKRNHMLTSRNSSPDIIQSKN